MKNDIMGNMVQSAVGPPTATSTSSIYAAWKQSMLSWTNLRPLERANTLLDQEFSLNTIVHWVRICRHSFAVQQATGLQSPQHYVQ
jgi:hypothetical protein